MPKAANAVPPPSTLLTLPPPGPEPVARPWAACATDPPVSDGSGAVVAAVDVTRALRPLLATLADAGSDALVTDSRGVPTPAGEPTPPAPLPAAEEPCISPFSCATRALIAGPANRSPSPAAAIGACDSPSHAMPCSPTGGNSRVPLPYPRFNPWLRSWPGPGPSLPGTMPASKLLSLLDACRSWIAAESPAASPAPLSTAFTATVPAAPAAAAAAPAAPPLLGPGIVAEAANGCLCESRSSSAGGT